MEQYKISQKPTGGQSNKTNNHKPVVPKHRQTKSLDPRLVVGGVVIAVLLIAGGIFFALRFNKKTPQIHPATHTKERTTQPVPGPTFTSVTSAVNNKQPGALNAYYAHNVHVIIKGRTIDQTVNASQVEGLIGSFINGAETPWDWHVSATQIALWQNGPYGDYFNGSVIVGMSQDGLVISIGIDENGQIATVFIAPASELVPNNSTTDTTAGSTSGSTGSDSTTGGGTTTSTTTDQDSD